MIEAALVAKLQTVSANVYPVVAPKAYQTPAVVWNRIGMDPTRSLNEQDEDGWVDVQVDVYGPVLRDIKQVSRQIVTLMRGWRDDTVRASTWENQIIWADDTTDVLLFRVTDQFRLYTAL